MRSSHGSRTAAEPRTALVTGGNRGIGREVCRQLAARGHRVYLGSRVEQKGKQAAASMSGDVIPIVLDLSETVAAVATVHALGEIDILVNNAGVHYDTWQQATNVDWRVVAEAFSTNLFGAWHHAAACVPGMDGHRQGRRRGAVGAGRRRKYSVGCGSPR